MPYLFVMALRKIIDPESEAFFEVTGKQIKVSVNNTVLHGNLIIGEKFPDYAPAFDDYTNMFVISKDIMMGSFVPFLNALSDEDHKRLTIELKDSKLKIYSDFSDSEYEGTINFAGDFVIDINGSFLAQTLDSINDDVLEMKFSNEDGVLIFDSETFHDQKSLITPVKRR